MKPFKILVSVFSLLIVLFSISCNYTKNDQQHSSETISSKESLGEKLFNDVSLSKDGTQSCSSCHDSDHAFIDPRQNLTSVDGATPGAVSTGQDDISLGDINTPSAAYAAFVPEFHFDYEEALFIGGLFLNGRASNLVEQATQPFLNPVEMQNTMENVVASVQGKYSESMKYLYGDDIFDSTEAAFDAIADSIATFERTEQFATFDSKFDKVLKDQTTFSVEEQRGLDLFIAEDKGNCAACHPVPDKNSNKVNSLFTDFSYDNLGVPENELVRSQNNMEADYVDEGLLNNPAVDDVELKGAFRVTSLRNVAVTAPYMHNGVFRDLETVVHFYNSRDVPLAQNPETGVSWKSAEINSTKNTEELGQLGLSIEEIKDIVAFLKTLTDERYEHLIP